MDSPSTQTSFEHHSRILLINIISVIVDYPLLMLISYVMYVLWLFDGWVVMLVIAMVILMVIYVYESV